MVASVWIEASQYIEDQKNSEALFQSLVVIRKEGAVDDVVLTP
jgi:hypothetical protein